MPKEKTKKIFLKLEPEFESVLASKDGNVSPFLETFVFQGENVSQENLGTIAGILEMSDESEESSYVVNYLISIIKKEYFSFPKRGAIESFESAMHKANLALAKLAEHGSISWIGNLNAAICVVEKNSILFTQTGTSKALLLRGQKLIDIFDFDSKEEEESEKNSGSNPLKTFQDVITGRVERNDKIILATEAVFSIFSQEEIKKGSLKFSREEFSRFLRTALVNELEKAAILLVNIQEKELIREKIAEKKYPRLNAFSQTSFAKKTKERKTSPFQEEERQKVILSIKEEYDKTKGEFVDKKTGHIYIKEDFETKEKNENLFPIKEYGQKIVSGGENFFSSIAKKTPLKISAEDSNGEKSASKETAKTFPKIKIFRSIILFSSSLAVTFWKKVLFPAKKAGWEFALKVFKKRSYVKNKLGRFKEGWNLQKASEKNFSAYLSRQPSREEKKSWFLKLSRKKKDFPKIPAVISPKNYSSFFNFLPDFSKIRLVFSSLGKREKIAAFSLLVLVFVVPYFIAGFMKNKDEEETKNNPPENFETEKIIPLANDRNVFPLNNLVQFSEKEASLGIISLNGKFFSAGKNGIFSLEEKKEFLWPENFKNPKIIFKMNDLNLIFLLKDTEVFSFSPASQKFQKESIDIPAEFQAVSAGSFMTYAYLLDKNSKQIYRYPRAEGGFGTKTSWLKENINISEVSKISVNENIFALEKGKILKFFQGKIEVFEIEETATPIMADDIFVETENENVYILDKTNSRVIALDGNGKIIRQFHNPFFKNASGLAIDKEKNLACLSGEEGVKGFSLE